MNPGTVALLLLSLGTLFGALFILRAQGRIISRLRRQRDEIETEEHRMFDFLHGLGESIGHEGATDARLHRTIVRGVAMVVDSHGAALYTLDPSGERLVPQYQSEGCPALIPVPPHIAEQARLNPTALDSYRSLTSVGADWGPFGQVLKFGRAMQFHDLGALPAFERGHPKSHHGVSAMVAPLAYGGRSLGVLAVANTAVAEPFSENDFAVFRSVAEQSAFALGNAIAHHAAAEKRRLDEELNTASEVQRILLPDREPKLDGYRIAGANVPAKVVSGDYFDFFPVEGGGLGVVIADVSGKGVPASLIMAMCRSVVRAAAAKTLSPAKVLAAANRQLFPDIREDMFISLAYAVLPSGSGDLQMARAGHDPPLHFIAAESLVETIKSPGMAIGIDAGTVFEKATRDHSLRLETGDVLLLYTDGVNEATNAKGEEFGMERLHSGLRRHAPQGARAVVDGIRAAVSSFVGLIPQNDDITLIAIEKR